MFLGDYKDLNRISSFGSIRFEKKSFRNHTANSNLVPTKEQAQGMLSFSGLNSSWKSKSLNWQENCCLSC